MLLYTVQMTPIASITHNFLESGHSHMECDAMHSSIESAKKYSDVFTMLDWITIFRQARRRNPFTVEHLRHPDFYDFQKYAQQVMKNKRQDEDGNCVNWLLVKSFRYQKDEPGVIFYRYGYTDEYTRIRVFGRGRPNLPVDLPRAHQHRIPISQAKKADLIKLCKQSVIPAEVHPWYEDLPTSSRAKDRLPAPDMQDSGDDDDEDLA